MSTWRGVPGYEHLYEVSNTGKVRSMPRNVDHYLGGFVRRGGKELAGCVRCGYRQVSLCKDGVSKTYRVHVLVALAFLGVRPAGMLICHRDGDRQNNKVSNLRYDTPQSNSDDMQAHGSVLKGQAHGNSKLTAAKVKKIRALAERTTQTALATKFGISVSQIQTIVYRRQWQHL